MPMSISGLKELTAKIDRFEPELHAGLPAAALESADIIAEQAKSNASFSSKIPGQISTRPSANGAQVVVAAGVYPHVLEAKVMEGDGYGGEFRHPVYDHGGWAAEQSHPFLEPALIEKHDEALAPIKSLIHRVITGG